MVAAGSPEVLVLGGGPAGGAAARLLALWGHDVRLVTKRRPPDFSELPESIPPSTRKLFDVLGVAAAVDDAGFVRSTGNTVWWGGEARVESFAGGGRGWQVTADAFSGVLLRAAREAGARIEVGAAASALAATGDAAFVLDCTGRAGVLARARRLRLAEPGHRIVALIARWRPGPAFDVPDASHTVIESYADGWAWSIPLAGGNRALAFMVDRARSNLARGRAARDVYDVELAKTVQFRRLLADAVLIEGPDGWDASMYSSTQYVADGREILVGDAASFIDPLSSAGVKKALASAWLAAVAVHTSLVRPAIRTIALDFYAAREAEVYRSFRDHTRRHLAGAASAYDHAFWSDRIDDAPADEERPRVEAAFARLRQRDTLALQRGAAVDIVERPAVSGREIVLEARVVTPADAAGAGARFVSDVDVLSLIELAPRAATVPELFALYNAHAAPAGLPEFLTALSTALARGWLEWRDGA